MPNITNSNVSATVASFDLSHSNHALRFSPERLTLAKRIVGSGDDARGLAVSYKLRFEDSTALAKTQNIQNVPSYLQVQDGVTRMRLKMFNRMFGLWVTADDVTENTGDIDTFPNFKFNSLKPLLGSTPNHTTPKALGFVKKRINKQTSGRDADMRLKPSNQGR